MTHSNPDLLTVGLVQVAPVWLNRQATLEKMLLYIDEAASKKCQLTVFSEALLPGYPFWLELTDGARFNSDLQKDLHAHYMQQAVQIEAGHLEAFQKKARTHKMALILGIIERPVDRGGHSLYCSMVYVSAEGEIANVHRKLMPTYEERLTWAPGDGHGLQVQSLGAFTVGGLNCWENWMPLPRAVLYGLGEDLHVAIWPGQLRNTEDITRFIAKESRAYVLSVSGLMRREDIPDNIPHARLIRKNSLPLLANGGSCISAPDGSWIIEPQTGEEGLWVGTLDHREVRRERQNFDPSGHYSRPDVTRLVVNRERQRTVWDQQSEI
ncbi:MAG: nitrilase [Saprospiraceae bacterium]|nr:MAG: nitrilase [Saprospiraceae bacterium]